MFLLYVYVSVLPLLNWRSARVLTVSVATTGDTRMHRYDYIRYCPARLIISLCIIDLFFMYYYININDTIATDTRFTTHIYVRIIPDDNGVGLVAVSYCSAKRRNQ